MKRNIIITGGAGFIGSHVVRLFVNKYPEYNIINVDKLTYAGNLENLKDIENKPNYKFVNMDICDFDAFYSLMQEEHVDGIIHLAAESHVDRSIENPEVFLDTNIKGTAVLMDACRKYDVKRGLRDISGKVQLTIEKNEENREYTFKTKLELTTGGNYGYTFRVMPKHEMLIDEENLDLVTWITKQQQ